MEEKKKRKPVYTCNLELTRISRDNVRFRVRDEKGLDLDVHHLQFARRAPMPDDGTPAKEYFPTDPDFNMDFIMGDLREMMKEAPADDPISEEDIRVAEEKQAQFSKWRELKLIIAVK